MADPTTYLDEDIPLADLVSALRQQLTLSATRAQGQDIQFTLGDIELELNVGVTRQKSGQGGVQFWVFTLGGNAGVTDSSIHTIRVTLKAQTPDGKHLRIHEEVTQRPR